MTTPSQPESPKPYSVDELDEQINFDVKHGMRANLKPAVILDAKRLAATAEHLRSLEQRIAANVDLAKTVVGYDRDRDFRSTPCHEKMIGGSDVCATCEAHCVVMEQDEPYYKTLELQVAKLPKPVTEDELNLKISAAIDKRGILGSVSPYYEGYLDAYCDLVGLIVGEKK